MVSLVRALVAMALSFVLTILTFGRVELNRTGRSTADDDSLGSSRPAAERPLSEGPYETPASKRDRKAAPSPPEDGGRDV